MTVNVTDQVTVMVTITATVTSVTTVNIVVIVTVTVYINVTVMVTVTLLLQEMTDAPKNVKKLQNKLFYFASSEVYFKALGMVHLGHSMIYMIS